MLLRLLATTGAALLLANGGADGEQHGSAAHARLRLARQALGGEARLASVQSLSIVGTARVRNQWFGRKPFAKEEFISRASSIRMLLPDAYLERQTGPDRVVRYSGFSGHTLLNHVVLPRNIKGGARYPPDMVQRERTDCAFLLFALLLRTDLDPPFRPDRLSGDTLWFRDAHGGEVSLDLDPRSNQPRRLSWVVLPKTGADTDQRPGVRVTVDLSAFKRVGDLYLAHKMVSTRDGVVSGERDFDVITINPALTPQSFALEMLKDD